MALCKPYGQKKIKGRKWRSRSQRGLINLGDFLGLLDLLYLILLICDIWITRAYQGLKTCSRAENEIVSGRDARRSRCQFPNFPTGVPNRNSMAGSQASNSYSGQLGNFAADKFGTRWLKCS